MLLACQNISKAFGTKEVLKDINFHVNEKEKIAIVGINGSGKTTLLKIIMGEESADSGQVVIAKDTTIGICPSIRISPLTTRSMAKCLQPNSTSLI